MICLVALVLVEAHVGEELARAVVAEGRVGERVAGLGARAGLDVVGVDGRRCRRRPTACRRPCAPSGPRSARRGRCGTPGGAGRACSPGTARRPPGARPRPRRARRSAGSMRWIALVVDLHLEVLSTSSGSSAARTGPCPGPARWSPPCGDSMLPGHGRNGPLRGRRARVATLTLNRPDRLNAIVPGADRRSATPLWTAPRPTTRSTRSACAGAGRVVLRRLRHRVGQRGHARRRGRRAVGPDRATTRSCRASCAPTCACGARPSP